MKALHVVAALTVVALGGCGPGEIDSSDLESIELEEQGLSSSPAYGTFRYEGSYPERTPCKFYLPPVPGGATRSAYLAGWGYITLKYFYSDGCGSFARIENAPTGRCAAVLDRSTDGGRTHVNVSEPVDPGINFAYTKMGNNLNGRVSRAALVCRPNVVLARTNWY